MKEFPIPQQNNDYHLSNNEILELYNDGILQKVKSVDTAVIQWIEFQAYRHGWKSVRWNTTICHSYCCLSLQPETLATIKLKTIEPSVQSLLTGAITRIAQHACRQGESNSRSWPSLNTLPEPKSWEMVGKKYAREIAIDIMKMYFDKGDFLKDLAKLAGSDEL
jgi:hypothetical protein